MKSGKPKNVKMAKAAPMKGMKMPSARPSKAHAWGEGKGAGFKGNC